MSDDRDKDARYQLDEWAPYVELVKELLALAEAHERGMHEGRRCSFMRLMVAADIFHQVGLEITDIYDLGRKVEEVAGACGSGCSHVPPQRKGATGGS